MSTEQSQEQSQEGQSQEQTQAPKLAGEEMVVTQTNPVEENKPADAG